MRPARQLWVVAHRWAGLTIALFLIVVGATGALLPFHEALTLAARPSLSQAAPPSAGARPLDAVTLAERVEAQTGGRIGYLPLIVPRDHVAQLYLTAPPGGPPLGFDTVWADPYSGAVRLRFRDGVLADGPQAIMSFLYGVHYSLAMGEGGIWMLGVAALIWTLDCFVGFYLTLPPHSRGMAAGHRSPTRWWRRWRPAWLVRSHARGHRLNVDLHRAGGLWLWPLLLVFAWSSVGFNLPSVHGPVMRAFGATEYFRGEPLARPLERPAIDRRAAVARGQALMADEAARRDFRILPGGLLRYEATTGLYSYRARTSLDWSTKDAATTIWFSGASGRLVHFRPPLGQSRADETMSWFYMLHMARVFGLPYRIFVSVLGLAVVALSATGVLIWTKKRSARLLGRRRARRGYAIDAGLPVAAE